MGGTELARGLRQRSTEAERLLWQRLRSRQLGGVKFRRQMPIARFIVDFAAPAVRLVVELDGSQHAERASDDARTRTLEAAGYHVLRFWNDEVLTNVDGVLQAVLDEIANARAG